MNALMKISEQVEEASDITDVSVERLTPEEIEVIWHSVVEKFAREEKIRSELSRSEFLWERFSDSFSIQNKNAWGWLDDFVKDKDVILFFNRDREETMYHMEAGASLSTLLGETYSFEFYLTDAATSYLICFNHHDYLIALGEAKAWLRTFQKKLAAEG